MSTKSALVTGSGKKRLGGHVAEALVRRGYDLAVHYHTSKEEAESTVAHFRQQGGEAEAFSADLADGDAVRDLFGRVRNRFDRLDVVVHCAAIWPKKKLIETTAADVQRCFAVNTLSTFLCVQQAGLWMAEQGSGGSIITFGDWAIRRPYRDYAAYFVSKGAIPTMTRCLAVELAELNPAVRVNCVLPGPVMIPDDVPAEERQAAIDATLMKREGSPKNIVQAVLYLVDNDFVTGTCLTVDGGRTVYGGDE